MLCAAVVLRVWLVSQQLRHEAITTLKFAQHLQGSAACRVLLAEQRKMFR
jgi:hypothetical protein